MARRFSYAGARAVAGSIVVTLNVNAINLAMAAIRRSSLSVSPPKDFIYHLHSSFGKQRHFIHLSQLCWGPDLIRSPFVCNRSPVSKRHFAIANFALNIRSHTSSLCSSPVEPLISPYSCEEDRNYERQMLYHRMECSARGNNQHPTTADWRNKEAHQNDQRMTSWRSLRCERSRGNVD